MTVVTRPMSAIGHIGQDESDLSQDLEPEKQRAPPGGPWSPFSRNLSPHHLKIRRHRDLDDSKGDRQERRRDRSRDSRKRYAQFYLVMRQVKCIV